jgi:hypothetical protein
MSDETPTPATRAPAEAETSNLGLTRTAVDVLRKASAISSPEIPKGLTRTNAVRLAWLRGKLRWKLDLNQREIYDLIMGCGQDRFYLNCGRRVGKTFLLAIIAIETALRIPNAVIKVVAPTAKLVRQALRPIYQFIFEDCPKNLRPKWNNMDGEYRFAHNGSVIQLAGCEDGNEESLRGSKADLVEFDECGFIRNLEYVARSILAPMLMTTGGMMLYSSTPPVSMAHDAAKIYHSLLARGATVTRTVYQNPRLDEEKLNRFLDNERGLLTLEQFKKTVYFRREYLAEFIVDAERAVVPEWDNEVEKDIVKIQPRPAHFHPYTVADWGFRRDASGILFGYYDFEAARLVIEQELLLFKERTETQALKIRLMERDLWENLPIYLRLGDGGGMGAQVNEDMQVLHGMTFTPVKKDIVEMQVNSLRMWVAERRLVIHPRCKLLIYQLQTSTWNESRKEFERTKEGHADLLSALIYFVRNLHQDANPFPRGYGRPREDFTHVQNPYAAEQERSTGAVVLNLFPFAARMGR